MSVVGPSGLGKTSVLCSMLTSKTFCPGFEKKFSYRNFQLLFEEFEKKMEIEFIKSLSFQVEKTLPDCLLNFDSTCEDSYQWKVFVKFIVFGRHRGINFFFVKHNLLRQSR